LQVDKDSAIEIQRAPAAYNLVIRNGLVSTRVRVRGKGKLWASCSDESERKAEIGFKFDIPETIDVVSFSKSAIPVVIEFNPVGEFEFGDLRLKGAVTASIFRAVDGRDAWFSSAIESGRITIPESQSEHEIRRNDVLTLQGLSTSHALFKSEKNTLSLQLDGTATTMMLGPAGSARDLRPSYLTAWYFDKSIGFLASAIALAWGTLWGVRKTVFR